MQPREMLLRRGGSRHGHLAPLISALVLVGCPTANLRELDAGRDASLDAALLDAAVPDAARSDAASLDAALADAASADAAPEDGGSDIVFADDFERDPLDLESPRWTMTRIDGESWYWGDESGTLRSGPGDSCVYWDDELCPRGPAMIHSPSFPVGTGELTIDVDVWARTGEWLRATASLFVSSDRVEPTWGVTPDGETDLSSWDYLGAVHFVPLVERPHVMLWSSSAAGASRLFDTPLATGTWYHLRVELCLDEVRLVVVERDTGAVTFATTPAVGLDVRPAEYYEGMFIVLMAEGREKAFDNLVVRRGCR